MVLKKSVKFDGIDSSVVIVWLEQKPVKGESEEGQDMVVK